MKNLHQIELSGYTAKTSEAAYLKLGTTDSYGIEQIQLVTDDAWRDLSITATFVTPESKTQVVVPESGLIDVPHEATAKPMTAESPGVLVFSGTGDGVRRISANLPYLVRDHAPVTGQETEPTPELYAQLIKQVSDASKAAYPRGGLKDQVLTKLSDAERDYAWKDPAGTGLPLIAEEDEGKVLSVVGQTAQWTENPNDKAKEWKLLIDTTLEEDVTNVSFDVDAEGIPFSCKELFVVSDQKAHDVSTSGYFMVRVNGNATQSFNGPVLDKRERLFKGYFMAISSHFYTVIAVVGDNDFNLGSSCPPYGNGLNGGDMKQKTRIEKIEIGMTNPGLTMSSGSTIRVYGR